MTTFVWSGETLIINQTTGAISYKPIEMRFVAKDGNGTFSYDISLEYEDATPDVALSLGTHYHFEIDGVAVESSLEFSLGFTSWSGGYNVMLTTFDIESEALETQMFLMSGTALPKFGSLAALANFAFDPSVSSGAITSGAFSEGMTISFDGLPNMTRTERDIIKGTNGNDVFAGGLGNDVIKGGRGMDTLNGNKGQDIVHGGKGADSLKGGLGADIFVFRKGDWKDEIKDFEDNKDTIRLDSSLWEEDFGKFKMLKQYGEITDEGLLLDFGKDELLIVGVTDRSSVRDDIEVV